MMGKAILMQFTGCLAILIALVHGVSAEYRLFPHVTAATPAHVLLLRFVWQASTMAWVSFGALLIIAPGLGAGAARLIGGIAFLNFAVAAIGGLIATGWGHYGWTLLSLLALLVAWSTPWMPEPKMP